MTEDEQFKRFAELVSRNRPGLIPKSVLEIGACDGAHTLRLASLFSEATIYTFEPNPATYPKLLKATENNDRIKCLNLAVSDFSGVIPFYQSMTDNHGCSSLFVASGKYNHVEPMPQIKRNVHCVRISDLINEGMMKPSEVLWLDAQGSELSILKGLGEYINTTQIVWTEFCNDHLYSGQPLWNDLVEFFDSHGFRLVEKFDIGFDSNGKCWWGDAFSIKI
jgi:FkbM family methyltransferase